MFSVYALPKLCSYNLTEMEIGKQNYFYLNHHSTSVGNF